MALKAPLNVVYRWCKPNAAEKCKSDAIGYLIDSYDISVKNSPN